ncbi:hypothetical protein IMSHALPRED_006829 [Imshaugia aleurites]|uniref:Uncharacterized protein n=1 Tax=Imshaugia aleurites TaxID=172621 RepID=A0A8H3FHA3_9LECA|nr:hypothetical protein IMSHALPRED_006829 [Imshaugia aleurites]
MSSSQSTTPCQPSIEETNTYLLIIVRILAAAGLSYLLRDLYQLIKRPLLSPRSPPGRPNAIAEENIGLDLDDTASATRASLDLDFGSYDEMDLGIRMPEPAYYPRGRW